MIQILAITILPALALWAGYLWGFNVGDREGLKRGKESRDPDVAGLKWELRILATYPGTTQANVIQNRYNQGRPEINEQDHPTVEWPIYVYNYWLDSQTYMDKLEEVLEVVKRENEYFVNENKRLNEASKN